MNKDLFRSVGTYLRQLAETAGQFLERKISSFMLTSSRLIIIYLVLFFIWIVLKINFNEDLAGNIFGTVFLGSMVGGVVFLLITVTQGLLSDTRNRRMGVFLKVLAILLFIMGLPLLGYGIVQVFVTQNEFLWGLLTLCASVIMILYAILSLVIYRK